MSIRTNWYRSIASVWVWYELAWRDDRKFTAEDIDETAFLLAYNAWVWKGPAMLAAVPGVAIVEGVVVAGAVASYAIGGVEGVENYIDFITEPTKMPERIAFTADVIYEEVIKEPLVAASVAYVGWWDRRVEEAKLVWSITHPQPLWRF